MRKIKHGKMAGGCSDACCLKLEGLNVRLEGEEILILADLVGGTPFNVAAALREELRDRRIKVMAGVNMAGLVEAVFSRPVYGLDELAAAVLAAGREGIRDLDCLDSEGQEPEFEDGL